MKDRTPEINLILKEIKVNENGPAAEAMQRLGLNYKKNHGVSISNLKQIAEKYKPNRELAAELRLINIRETVILAEMIEDPQRISLNEIEKIVNKIQNIEHAEQTVLNLLQYADECRNICVKWTTSEKPYVKVTAYILFSILANKKENIPDAFFETIITRSQSDFENENLHVRNSIARALRNIALRNEHLKRKVLEKTDQINKNKTERNALIYEESVPLLDY